ERLREKADAEVDGQGRAQPHGGVVLDAEAGELDGPHVLQVVFGEVADREVGAVDGADGDLRRHQRQWHVGEVAQHGEVEGGAAAVAERVDGGGQGDGGVAGHGAHGDGIGGDFIRHGHAVFTDDGGTREVHADVRAADGRGHGVAQGLPLAEHAGRVDFVGHVPRLGGVEAEPAGDVQ